MASELEPTFEVTVSLDGDDDAQIQTENFDDALGQALQTMLDDGLIRGYTFRKT